MKAALLGFAASIVLIPFRYRGVLLARPAPPVASWYTNFLFYASDAAVLFMLATWMLSLIISPRKVSLGPRHIWIPLAGLTLAGALSSATSYDPQLTLYHCIRLFILFWFYTFMINELRSTRWIVIPVGIQVALQSGIALAQFFTQRSVGLADLGETHLDPAIAGISVVTSNGMRLLRAYGLTDHPNILGGCLAFGSVLLLWTLLRGHQPFPAFAVLLPTLAALLASFSRAAWLAFIAGGTIIVAAEVNIRQGKTTRRMVCLGTACMLILAVFILAYRPFFGVRLNQGNSFGGHSAERQSIGGRAILINSSLPLLRDHGLFGVGLGTTPMALKAYYPDFALSYEPPHWTLLDAAVETGVLGGLSYLALLLFPLLVFIRQRKTLITRPSATVAFALLVAIAFVGFFDYYTWLVPAGRLWQWLAWGLWGWTLERATV